MTDIEKLAFRYRAKLIIDNLKNCNAGNEVHEVGNMKHTAQGVLTILEDNDPKDSCLIEGMLGRLEIQQIAFFKKKFEHLSCGKSNGDSGKSEHKTEVTQIMKTDKPVIQTQQTKEP